MRAQRLNITSFLPGICKQTKLEKKSEFEASDIDSKHKEDGTEL